MNVLVRGPLEAGDPMVALHKSCLAHESLNIAKHSKTRYDLGMSITFYNYIYIIYR